MVTPSVVFKDIHPAVLLKDVSYQYPRQTSYALSNVNLEIQKGEFLGLVGATGAGKSTLCLALNGIVPQFYGGRFFGGIRVSGLDTVEHPVSELARHVGMVFEDPETQLVSISVENEIAFALENLKFPRYLIKERIQSSLEAVRLAGMEKKHPHELSGGQKQRLAIAAAIAIQPDLLVLDEPTSQLDPVGEEEVFSTIHSLNREHGITIMMTSHAAEEMAVYADRIAIIADGEIIATGTPEEIYTQADVIEKLHLRLPQVTSTFYKLSRRGIAVPKLPVRMEEAIPLLDELSKCPTHSTSDLSATTGSKVQDQSTQADKSTGSPCPGSPRTGLKISVVDTLCCDTGLKEKSILQVEALTHSYPDGTKAIEDISLDIHEGEFVLIVGQNGAGKSTFIKHFVNLLKPTSGTVKFNGIPTLEYRMSELASRIGFISQNPDNQLFNKTVEEEIAYAMKFQGFDLPEIETRTAESLEAMGLTPLKDRHPLSLSKGDRARVVIGAILALKPDILIFDEPTTGQDYLGSKNILNIARELHHNHKTIIVVSHHLYLMPAYAERVIVMGKGNILLDGDLRTVFHDVETLKKTFITPPQAVQISRELIKRNPELPPLLTPEEIASCFIGNT